MSYLRIATEEAFAPPDLITAYRKLLADKTSGDPGFDSLMGYHLNNPSERTRQITERLQDIGEWRIADMDATGIAKQIVGITAPGVQIFADASLATALARSANDQIADAVRKYPDRFAGLAAIAPQNPQAAAQELERAVKQGFKGGIINSHTRGEYLDNQKFWDIFAAAEALDVPLYLHPTTPPPAMIQPFLESGLDGAVYGFAVETGLHMLRIVTSGVFDRFPKLRMVVGHLGEGLPYWLFRIDFMHGASVRAGRYPSLKPLQRKASEYLRENFYYTTSGMAWQPPILYAQSVLGMDRVLYAMDYPYQFVPEEVRVTDELPISDVDKKRFYQGNAETVFKLV